MTSLPPKGLIKNLNILKNTENNTQKRENCQAISGKSLIPSQLLRFINSSGLRALHIWKKNANFA